MRESRSERLPGQGLQQGLGLGLRLRRPAQQMIDEFAQGRVEFVGARHDFVHEADAVGLGGGKPLAAEQVTAALAHADRGQEKRGHAGRDPPQAGFIEQEMRLVGRHRQIARGDQADPRAVGRPLHPGDRRLGHFVKGREELRQQTLVVNGRHFAQRLAMP